MTAYGIYALVLIVVVMVGVAVFILLFERKRARRSSTTCTTCPADEEIDERVSEPAIGVLTGRAGPPLDTR